jgi:hypothetical protein
MIDGLHAYCDSHDVAHPDETIVMLRRCGAVLALPCVESVDGRRASADRLKRFRDACAAADIACHPFTFPSLLGELAESREHFVKACELFSTTGQLDAEPTQGFHWSTARLAPWLALPCLETLTTTRAEARHLGAHGLPMYAQLESQTSFDSLDDALRIFTKTTPLDRITLVSGVFNEPRDPRTLDEVHDDLVRGMPQARRVRRHAIWSAHTLDEAKADLVRAWTVDTWAPPIAA